MKCMICGCDEGKEDKYLSEILGKKVVVCDWCGLLLVMKLMADELNRRYFKIEKILKEKID